MAAKTKFFTSCNGTVVELSRCGWSPIWCIAQSSWTRFIGQSRDVRTISSCGGGRPTVYDFAGGLCPLCQGWHYAERMITYKANPSLHECDGRCMSAQGPNCECKCGGANHGKAS